MAPATQYWVVETSGVGSATMRDGKEDAVVFWDEERGDRDGEEEEEA